MTGIPTNPTFIRLQPVLHGVLLVTADGVRLGCVVVADPIVELVLMVVLAAGAAWKALTDLAAVRLTAKTIPFVQRPVFSIKAREVQTRW